MTIKIVPKKDVIKIDNRNVKKTYLETDSICDKCGAINNSYYENKCNICDCGGTSFIRGNIGISLRLLLDFSFEDLKGLAEIRGCRIVHCRPRIIVNILKKMHPDINKYNINETLIWIMIKRQRKSLWYLKDIERAIVKTKKRIKIISKDECDK